MAGKKAITVLLAICMAVSIFTIPITTQAAETHTPQTYEFNSGFGKICYKGDILTFTCETLPAVTTPNGTYDLSSGFRITDQHGNNTDVTSKFAEILESAPAVCGTGVYTKVKITGDKPVFITYSGATPSATYRLDNNAAVTYRVFTIDATVCEPSYAINWDTDGGVLYKKVNPTSFSLSNSEFAFTTLEDPVKEGYHFDHWQQTAMRTAVNFSFSPNPASYISATKKLTVNVATPFYNCGTATYSGNGGYVITAANGAKTLKACYVAKCKYYNCGTVTFNANGGTIDGYASMIGQVRVNDDCEIMIPSSSKYTPQRSGYKFEGWFIDKNLTTAMPTDYSSSFKMASVTSDNPLDRSKTVYAKWSALPGNQPTTQYTVTVETDGHGEAGAAPVKATSGTIVSLHATSYAGYKFKEWQVISGGAKISNNQFTMPASNVKIKAIFEAGPTPIPIRGLVSVMLAANGTITVDKKEANEGETVTVTATPNTGYKLKAITVFDGLGQDLSKEIGLVIKNNSFVMPDMNVKIQATFEKIASNGKTGESIATEGDTDGKINFATEIPDDCVLDIRTVPVPENIKQDGVAYVLFQISVMQNNKLYAISNNQMTVTLTLPNEMLGKKDYYVSYLDENGNLSEKQTATLTGNTLQFSINHLSGYLVEGVGTAEVAPSEKADYTAVDAALAKVPQDLSLYTDASVAELNSAVNAVVRDKSFSEQSVVDGYAAAVEKAVAELVKKNVSEPDKNGSIIWIVLAVLVAGGGAAAFVILKKRKNKESD